MLPAAGAGKGCSPSDTGLHRRQRAFMKGASPEVLKAYRFCIDQAGVGFLKPPVPWREQEPHPPTSSVHKE